MKNYWKVKPIKTKPKQFHLNFDTDKDGVLDWEDCSPFNPRRHQQVSIEEFRRKLIENRDKINFVRIIGQYGILKNKYPDGKEYYGIMDLKTGLQVADGRETIEEAKRDIEEGLIEDMKRDPRYAFSFSVEETYKLFQRQNRTQEKYGKKVFRFKPIRGQRVLDIGAGTSPDIRATHAIDKEKPYDDFIDIDYKWGYDFNNETVNLPYPSNYFDVVVSYGALGRNFHSYNICKEIYRVLKIGGRFEFNPDYKETVEAIKRVGFILHKESFFSELNNEKIEILVGVKK